MFGLSGASFTRSGKKSDKLIFILIITPTPQTRITVNISTNPTPRNPFLAMSDFRLQNQSGVKKLWSLSDICAMIDRDNNLGG